MNSFSPFQQRLRQVEVLVQRKTRMAIPALYRQGAVYVSPVADRSEAIFVHGSDSAFTPSQANNTQVVNPSYGGVGIAICPSEWEVRVMSLV